MPDPYGVPLVGVLATVIDGLEDEPYSPMQSSRGRRDDTRGVGVTQRAKQGPMQLRLKFGKQAWSMLGGDVFEDDERIVLRLEIPGMDKRDFRLEVRDEALVVSGEKRFGRERTDGRYRVLQCAYGSFRRVVPLPVRVRPDKATARYKDGVLRVELAKLEPGSPKRVTVKVA